MIIFRILWHVCFMIIAIQDYYDFQYHWILGIIWSIINYFINPKQYLVMILMLLCPMFKNKFIGNGDIPLILFIIMSLGHIPIFISCIIGILLRQNKQVPMATSIYIAYVLFNVL